MSSSSPNPCVVPAVTSTSSGRYRLDALAEEFTAYAKLLRPFLQWACLDDAHRTSGVHHFVEAPTRSL